MLKAYIFDLDGVLTETSEQHYKAWKKMAEEINIEIDETFNESLKGISREESLNKILKHGNQETWYSGFEKQQMMDKKNNYYLEQISKFDKSNLFEGTEALLKKLKAKNMKIGLGSASKNAPLLIKKLGIEEYIDYIVNPAKVERGKPFPDIFLEAANKFLIPAINCVGVEDAKSGIEAINSAGMMSVGIGHKRTLYRADLVYKTIKDVNIDEIEKKYEEILEDK